MLGRCRYSTVIRRHKVFYAGRPVLQVLCSLCLWRLCFFTITDFDLHVFIFAWMNITLDLPNLPVVSHAMGGTMMNISRIRQEVRDRYLWYITTCAYDFYHLKNVLYQLNLCICFLAEVGLFFCASVRVFESKLCQVYFTNKLHFGGRYPPNLGINHLVVLF